MSSPVCHRMSHKNIQTQVLLPHVHRAAPDMRPLGHFTTRITEQGISDLMPTQVPYLTDSAHLVTLRTFGGDSERKRKE